MKKTILLISLLVFMLVLCSCGSIDIICIIDDEFNSEMIIDIVIAKDDLDEAEIDSILMNLEYLVEYWKTNGYETELIHSDDSYEINLKMSAKAETLEEAYDNLAAMMSNDYSPFSYVEGGYSSAYFDDIYNISAKVDLTNLVDHDTLYAFPVSQREKVYTALDSINGTLTFALQGDSIDDNGNVASTSNTASFSFKEPIELSKIMKIKNIDNQEKFDVLEGEISFLSDQTRKYTIIVAILAFCLFMVIIFFIVFTIKNRHEKSKSNKPIK